MKTYTFDDMPRTGIVLGRKDIKDIIEMLRQDKVTPLTKNLRLELAEKLEKQQARAAA